MTKQAEIKLGGRMYGGVKTSKTKQKMPKVIYVCPFAHYSGHHPHVSTVEPRTLAQAGVEIKLLTFCGITNDPDPGVEHLKVLAGNYGLLRLIRKNTISRWFIMLGETVVTLAKAMWLRHKLNYDLVHVRDGEPFLWVSHLLSMPFRNQKWVVSLTAANLVGPSADWRKLFNHPFLLLYTCVMRLFINCRIWQIVYRLSLGRNSFVFTPQNERMCKRYAEYLNGAFSGHLTYIPWGIDDHISPISKHKAREYLGLPQDKLVLLSFGAPHSGKDMATVIKAIRLVPDVLLVHAGIQAFSLGSSPLNLAHHNGVEGKLKMFDYYIPEEEKPYFFFAADALVLSYFKIFESTSSMLWEAAKYRLPVISSDANTLGQDVERYKLGLLFEAENPQALGEAIIKYRGLPSKEIGQFKIGAQSFTEDFSSEKWANRYIEVYKGLV